MFQNKDVLRRNIMQGSRAGSIVPAICFCSYHKSTAAPWADPIPPRHIGLRPLRPSFVFAAARRKHGNGSRTSIQLVPMNENLNYPVVFFSLLSFGRLMLRLLV
jgi:hypothetical protein